MASPAKTPESRKPKSSFKSFNDFFVWREFAWGAIAGAFGEGMMHPVDTMKTRMQSQVLISGIKSQMSLSRMIKTIWVADGFKGFYRGIAPGVTGSLATGATYFGVIESTKKWLDEAHPNLGGYWSHFIAGAIGDTLGSVVYVPCEVIKQRMQVQGTRKSWNAMNLKQNPTQKHMYCYYTGMFQAGRSIFREHGLRGLYAGYWSTLARDVPFAGLMVTFYEAFKDLAARASKAGLAHKIPMNPTTEGLILGGLAGGLAAYLTTPLDVMKTRLQVQGPSARYAGWYDVMKMTWTNEGLKGLFRGSIPRISWYIPASALTFMAVECLRDHFGSGLPIISMEASSPSSSSSSTPSTSSSTVQPAS
ncbi:mitochondrial substrate carrier family protein [Wolffia australiana]